VSVQAKTFSPRPRTKPLATENDSHIEVLLVEDRPGDTRLTKEAFHHRGKPLQLHHAWNGAEAMDFLKRKGVFEDAPRPDLILLDLDIPEMDGREVLARIKRDPNLKAIPTIILTTSNSAADILLCYKLHANCYLQKPANWDEFDYLVTSIDRFWLSKGRLPQKSSSKSFNPDAVGRLTRNSSTRNSNERLFGL
jgi:chemotaxis family two-component system response regulator Rcp1